MKRSAYIPVLAVATGRTPAAVLAAADPDWLVSDLDRAGFDVEAVFSCDSPRPHPAGQPMTGIRMHLVATARA